MSDGASSSSASIAPSLACVASTVGRIGSASPRSAARCRSCIMYAPRTTFAPEVPALAPALDIEREPAVAGDNCTGRCRTRTGTTCCVLVAKKAEDGVVDRRLEVGAPRRSSAARRAPSRARRSRRDGRASVRARRTRRRRQAPSGRAVRASGQRCTSGPTASRSSSALKNSMMSTSPRRPLSMLSSRRALVVRDVRLATRQPAMKASRENAGARRVERLEEGAELHQRRRRALEQLQIRRERVTLTRRSPRASSRARRPPRGRRRGWRRTSPPTRTCRRATAG